MKSSSNSFTHGAFLSQFAESYVLVFTKFLQQFRRQRWIEFSFMGRTVVVGSDDNAEEILLKHIGLTKVDIASMQASLVDVCSKPQRSSSQNRIGSRENFTMANADTISDCPPNQPVKVRVSY
jgi:hypothetical protein